MSLVEAPGTEVLGSPRASLLPHHNWEHGGSPRIRRGLGLVSQQVSIGIASARLGESPGRPGVPQSYIPGYNLYVG